MKRYFLADAAGRHTGVAIAATALVALGLFGACTSASNNAATKPATAPAVEQVKPAEPAPEVVPAGWKKVEGENGIYWRWCTNNGECSADRVIGDNAYVLAQVWCKERACGDIYARVNLLNEQDVVVGWTNDTAYGGAGQTVQLTFDSYQDGWKSAQMTELHIRG